MSNGSTTLSPAAPSTNGTAAPSSGGAPVKACIVKKSGGNPIYFMFNPKEYEFTKSNQWGNEETKGTNTPKIEFKGGQPTSLSLQLVFDTYGLQPPKDVRKEYTNALWELTLVEESTRNAKNNKARPPTVLFMWGKSASPMWSFEAVITKMSQKFTMFLADGTPVRATVNLTLQQAKDERQSLGWQNPTSGGVDRVRLWTVQEGDTLAWIAYRHYGDTAEWRRIADANRLTQVRHLRPGTTLELPGA